MDALEEQSTQDLSPYSVFSNVINGTVNHPGQHRHEVIEIQELERI